MSPEQFPEFPASRQVSLDDRASLENLFSAYPSPISERTFGSIFAWRNYGDRANLSFFEGHLIISWFKPRFGKVILPPVGPESTAAIQNLFAGGSTAKPDFKEVYGLVGPEVSALVSAGIACDSLRDEWDYVYQRRDLVELDGPKYHTQRKELKKATSELSLVFEPMTKTHREACLELEETWCDLKHCTFDKYSHAEDLALRESIEHMEALGFFGGVVVANGKVQALTIGERLDSETAVVHFEKANPSIRGLYQFVNQQFCEISLQGFEFVNREQDVGEPGLRRAKEGYHPHHFVEKHIAMIRGSA